jgi:hypothetical protein
MHAPLPSIGYKSIEIHPGVLPGSLLPYNHFFLFLFLFFNI